MAGAKQTPFDAGSYPMKESQWNIMAKVAAELCSFYNIPVSDTTVLGHGEVQAKLGNAQNGKWDPMVLPWDTSKTISQVGDLFRARVSAHLAIANFLNAVRGIARAIGDAF